MQRIFLSVQCAACSVQCAVIVRVSRDIIWTLNFELWTLHFARRAKWRTCGVNRIDNAPTRKIALIVYVFLEIARICSLKICPQFGGGLIDLNRYNRLSLVRVQRMILERDGRKVYGFHVDAANCAVVHGVIIYRHVFQVGRHRPLGRRRHIVWGATNGKLNPQWHIKVV